jgi:ankyrin repeat protein
MTSIKKTPLHLAAMRGSTQIVKALINKKANPDIQDFD